MDLTTSVAGIQLEHPLMNAAGTCKLLEDVRKISVSATSAIMVGSITLASREGDSGQVYWDDEIYSLNSIGLPNRGVRYYESVLPEMVSIAHGVGKPLFVSVAGFTPNEYALLAEVAFQGGADLVELNLGCPNIWGEKGQKRIACFDLEMVAETHRLVEGAVGSTAKVADKISPHSDPVALETLARVIASSRLPKVVTTTNTFPNTFLFDESMKPIITPGGGLAGYAGDGLKPIGLGQVRQLRALLPERIEIMGVGGISLGRDILEYRKCGAVATQIATIYFRRHEKVFSDLLTELVDVITHGQIE